MAGLLHIESSPAGPDSASIRIASAFLESWLEQHAGRRVRRFNLWEEDLPALNGPLLEARGAVEAGLRHSPGQAVAWSGLRQLAGLLLEADGLVISAPMWNFGIPYRLKHFIDCVTQPNLTYRGSPEAGFEGLIPGKPAALILARGGRYRPGTDRVELDFQRGHLEAWLGFLGFRPVETILVEPTSGPVETVEKALVQAATEARRVAARF